MEHTSRHPLTRILREKGNAATQRHISPMSGPPLPHSASISPRSGGHVATHVLLFSRKENHSKNRQKPIECGLTSYDVAGRQIRRRVCVCVCVCLPSSVRPPPPVWTASFVLYPQGFLPNRVCVVAGSRAGREWPSAVRQVATGTTSHTAVGGAELRFSGRAGGEGVCLHSFFGLGFRRRARAGRGREGMGGEGHRHGRSRAHGVALDL